MTGPALTCVRPLIRPNPATGKEMRIRVMAQGSGLAKRGAKT